MYTNKKRLSIAGVIFLMLLMTVLLPSCQYGDLMGSDPTITPKPTSAPSSAQPAATEEPTAGQYTSTSPENSLIALQTLLENANLENPQSFRNVENAFNAYYKNPGNISDEQKVFYNYLKSYFQKSAQVSQSYQDKKTEQELKIKQLEDNNKLLRQEVVSVRTFFYLLLILLIAIIVINIIHFRKTTKNRVVLNTVPDDTKSTEINTLQLGIKELSDKMDMKLSGIEAISIGISNAVSKLEHNQGMGRSEYDVAKPIPDDPMEKFNYLNGSNVQDLSLYGFEGLEIRRQPPGWALVYNNRAGSPCYGYKQADNNVLVFPSGSVTDSRNQPNFSGIFDIRGSGTASGVYRVEKPALFRYNALIHVYELIEQGYITIF